MTRYICSVCMLWQKYILDVIYSISAVSIVPYDILELYV